MKRISYWMMSTLTVVVLLFGYRTSTSSQPATATAAATETTSPPPVSAPTTQAPTTPAPTTPAPTTAPATAGSTGSTVTGAAVNTRYGPVQVRLALSGGRIVDVQVIQYPDGNGRDQEINSQALPILVGETEAAQNAQIDMVSGATYTSQGYLTSLQSALDQAGIR